MMFFIELCLKSCEIILAPSSKLKKHQSLQIFGKISRSNSLAFDLLMHPQEFFHPYLEWYLGIQGPILQDISGGPPGFLGHCNPYVLTLGGLLSASRTPTFRAPRAVVLPRLLRRRPFSLKPSAIGTRLGFQNPVTSWNAWFFAGPFYRKFTNTSRPKRCIS